MSNFTVSLVLNGKNSEHEVETNDALNAVAVATLRQARGLLGGLAGAIAGPDAVMDVLTEMFEKGEVSIDFSIDDLG